MFALLAQRLRIWKDAEAHTRELMPISHVIVIPSHVVYYGAVRVWSGVGSACLLPLVWWRSQGRPVELVKAEEASTAPAENLALRGRVCHSWPS